MAQVLKEEQRNKILDSARNEFLRNGIDGSSMRNIAKNADTTVGNVYKYYNNKQEIIDVILMPVVEKLRFFDKYQVADIISMNNNSMNSILEKWVDNLVEVQDIFPDEMHILLNDERINRTYQEQLLTMLKGIINVVAVDRYTENESKEMMAQVVSRSIFAGIREGVIQKCYNEVSKEDFSKIMKQFMKNSIMMVEHISQEE